MIRLDLCVAMLIASNYARSCCLSQLICLTCCTVNPYFLLMSNPSLLEDSVASSLEQTVPNDALSRSLWLDRLAVHIKSLAEHIVRGSSEPMDDTILAVRSFDESVVRRNHRYCRAHRLTLS